MASPAGPSGEVTSDNGGSSADIDISLPSGTARKMAAVSIRSDKSGSFAWPSGWTEIEQGVSTGQADNFGSVAVSDEEISETTVTPTWSGTAYAVAVGWTQDGDVDAIYSPTAATGTGTAPDPPAWSTTDAAQDVRVIPVVTYITGNRSVSAYPETADNLQGQVGGNGGSGIGICSVGDTATQSYDPGSFTLSGTAVWAAFTIVVPEAASGTDYTESESEDIGVTDSVSYTLEGEDAVSISEAVGVTDSTTRAQVIKRTISESVGVSDVVSIPGEVRVPGDFSLSDFAAIYDGINLPASGDISQWVDSSGNDRHLEEDASGSGPPSVTTSYFDGEKAARFVRSSGEALEYDEGSEFYTGDIGIIAVFQLDSLVSSEDRVLMSAATGGSGTTWKHVMGTTDVGGHNYVLMSGDGGGAAHLLFGTPDATDPHILVHYIRNSGDDDAWVDGVQELDGENSGGNNLRGWRLGSRESDDRWFDGPIAYVAIIEMDGFDEADLLAAANDVGVWFNIPGFGTDYTESETESVGVGDSVSVVHSKARENSEAVGVSDTTESAVGAARPISDDVGVGDSVSWVSNAARTVIDTVGVIDGVSRSIGVGRENSEPIGVEDSVVAVKAIQISIDESVGVIDSVSRVAPAIRSTSETVGISDAVSENENNRDTISEPINITDFTSRIHAAARSVVDNAGIADSVSYSLTSGLQESAVEDVGVSDGVTTAKSIPRLTTEPIAISDLNTHILDAKRTLFDNATITDSTTTATNKSRATTDDIGVTDSVSAARQIRVTISEPVGVEDSTSRIHTVSRSITDPANISDTTSSLGSGQIADTNTDSINVSDTTTIIRTSERSSVEIVGVTDSVSYSLTTANTETSTEDAQITDSISIVCEIARPNTDDVGVVDSVTYSLSRSRSINESVGVTDIASTVEEGDFAKTNSDSVGVTDSTTRLTELHRTNDEQINVSDSVSPAKSIPRSTTDDIGVVDSVAVQKHIAVVISESIGIGDTTTRVSSTYRSIVEIIAAFDEVIRVGGSIVGPPPDLGQRSFASTSHSGSLTERTFDDTLR